MFVNEKGLVVRGIWEIIEIETERELADDPAKCKLTRQKYEEVGHLFRDVFVQRSRGDLSLVEKHIALQCIWAIEAGKIWVCGIDMGDCPGPDSDVGHNGAALADLPEPFFGKFAPGGWSLAGQDDGYVGWDGEANGMLGGKDAAHSLRGNLSLEVGTMSAGKAFLYLHGGGEGFARWPYGSTVMWLLCPTRAFAAECIERRTARTDQERSENV